MQHIFVFVLSVLSATLMLACERFIGIGWDYHVDSVTYANTSFEVVRGVLSQGITSLPNTGYYFIVSFLGQNVTLITIYNIVVYSITNIFIANFHWSYDSKKNKIITLTLLLLLLNPYRIHLATTLLKDTTIIFLIVISICNFKYSWISFFLCFLIRVASIFYLIALLPKKYKRFFLFFFGVIGVILLMDTNFSNHLMAQIDGANSSNMKFRDFDTIPTFQEYGYLGIGVRGVLWPLLAITGGFFIISPNFLFAPLSIGCVMNIIYSWLTTRKSSITFNVLSSMAIFAVFAPGFTSYIRYVYPLITIAPLLTLKENQKLR